MAQDYKYRDIPSVQGMSLTGIASWPKAQAPDFRFDAEKGDLSCNLIMSPAEIEVSGLEAQLRKIDAEGAEFFKQHHRGVKPSGNFPIRKEEKKQEIDGKTSYVETGNYIVAIKCKGHTGKPESLRPVVIPVVSVNGGVPMTEDLMGGAKVRVAFEARTYFVPATGHGVSLKLQGVLCYENGVGFQGPTVSEMFGNEIIEVEEPFEVTGDATEEIVPF